MNPRTLFAALVLPLVSPHASADVPPLKAPFDAAAAGAAQQEWAKRLGQPVKEETAGGLAMILIPPGSFVMGADARVDEVAAADPARYWTPETATGITRDERPAHPVTLTRPFRIAATETTIGQFRRFVEATGYVPETIRDGRGGDARGVGEGLDFRWDQPYGPDGAKEADLPATHLTWRDAVAYCEWLTRTEGRPFRLPTEAEWEWAARAGGTGLWSFGDDPARLAEHAVLGQRRFERTASRQPNAFGLFDVHGNVWEWTADRGAAFPGPEARTDPAGPEQGSGRVRRGGAATVPIEQTRTSHRKWSPENYRGTHVGFRVVSELPAQP